LEDQSEHVMWMQTEIDSRLDSITGYKSIEAVNYAEYFSCPYEPLGASIVLRPTNLTPTPAA
jgi:hypothetical protein